MAKIIKVWTLNTKRLNPIITRAVPEEGYLGF